jgi:putative flippase GtrA
MSMVQPIATNERPRGWNALPPLLRFFVVGGANTLFGYGAYATLLFVGLHYAAAALLGTIAGVIFNFFTTGRLVFGHARSDAIGRFVAVYALLYGVNVALLSLLQGVRVGAHVVGPYLAGLLLIVPMALLSFVLMRRFVFRSPRAAD